MIGLLALGGLAMAAPEPPWCLFSYFIDNGEDGLHLALSRDGYGWEALNGGRAVLAPEVGKKLMRDPHLAQGPDGTFHLVWTTGWQQPPVIGHASSRDLLTWSPQQAIGVMATEPTAHNAWAPELFWDAERGEWLIFWSSTIPGRFAETDATGDEGWNHRIYACTTRDFAAFGPTRLLFDAGFNVIDATMLAHGGRYWLIVKDETRHPVRKNLRVAVANHAAGPYGEASAPFTGDWVEGPSALHLGEDVVVYFDHYAAPQHYGAMRTRDLKTWEDVTSKLTLPPGTRHGTALRVDATVAEGLLRRWP